MIKSTKQGSVFVMDDIALADEPEVMARYRLKAPNGEYLHQRKAGLTDNISFAWQGSAEEAKAVLFEQYRSSALTMEPIP